MGEFTGTDDSNPTSDVKSDGEQMLKPTDGFQTDVEGIVAPSSVKYGKDEFPCFDVSDKEFYQNMTGGRKRIRFQTDSPAQKYMQGTKYQRKFYIKHVDSNGKALVRSIK